MKVYRIMISKWGLYTVERRYLGFLWWPVFKTYNAKGAMTYIDTLCVDYNEQTMNYEVSK